ncbi:hypothetical protein CTI12_AA105960 [Artemisia annua]|uniref:Uncharacterized protein n=1 Tax=Artemisia annua TaxID=35608 RepID=A0A2U1PW19_ARTAN|nr:hypothetical protein CTI12_AA105960 [Artemisia annua]
MVDKAIKLILGKEATDNVRVDDVMDKIDEIQEAAGKDKIKFGRSLLERTIKDIIADLKKKAPRKRIFRNNRNRRI